MGNLIDPSNEIPRHNWWQKLHQRQHTLVIAGVCIGFLLICILVLSFITVPTISKATQEAQQAKQSLTYAQVAIGNQDFPRARKDVNESQQHLGEVQSAVKRLSIYKAIPGITRQVEAVEHVLDAAMNVTSGLQIVIDVGEKMNNVIAAKGDSVAFSDITAEEKRDVLKTLSESRVELQSVRSQIELAILSIEQIPSTGLLQPIREVVEPLQQQLPVLETIIHQAIPAAETLPTILGYPNEKTYLFLLQNNRELRPTGGFIGTYGVVKLHNGEIQQFTTDNVYNLDNPASTTVTEPSPLPIAQHTSTQNWLFRNINWSPDFPTTAIKAEQKYNEEGGQEPEFDGVIAVTPTFIESLLALTGPMTIDGIEFTADNLFETLQYQVEFGYSTEGVSDADRKEVIGHLADELVTKIFALPKNRFAELWGTFIENVDQKQILIYLDDQLTEQLVMEQNWGGEMKEYNGDYLGVFDANLAALKTDNVMERSLSYTLSNDNGDYYGTATMRYKNNGQFDQFHTRYRTYTRFYLPKGATLVEHSGFMTGDKLQGGVPTDPDIYDETITRPDGSSVTYTVIGGFTSIEPKQEGMLTIRYKMPKSVASQIEQKKYTLLVQKQAGTKAHGLHISIETNKRINELLPLDETRDIRNNTVSIDSDLSEDRSYTLTFD